MKTEEQDKICIVCDKPFALDWRKKMLCPNCRGVIKSAERKGALRFPGVDGVLKGGLV